MDMQPSRTRRMSRRRVTNTVFFSALLATALCLPEVNARDTAPASSESISTETLLKTSESWDGKAYGAYPSGTPEITILKIVIPPHTALPWHTHPMPNAAYVVSGELTVETKDGKTRLLKAGDVLPETVGVIHRGHAGDHEVTLIVFYAGAQGMKLSELAH